MYLEYSSYSAGTRPPPPPLRKRERTSTSNWYFIRPIAPTFQFGGENCFEPGFPCAVSASAPNKAKPGSYPDKKGGGGNYVSWRCCNRYRGGANDRQHMTDGEHLLKLSSAAGRFWHQTLDDGDRDIRDAEVGGCSTTAADVYQEPTHAKVFPKPSDSPCLAYLGGSQTRKMPHIKRDSRPRFSLPRNDFQNHLEWTESAGSPGVGGWMRVRFLSRGPRSYIIGLGFHRVYSTPQLSIQGRIFQALTPSPSLPLSSTPSTTSCFLHRVSTPWQAF